MPPIAAGTIVFVTSAAVLVLEILAGRLLAPYVGVTLETYTGIIGTVLAGIAAGAWYGGKLADRIDPRKLLGPMVLSGGVLALLVVPVVTFLGAALPGGGPVTIVALSLAAFFAPAAVLSAVTPTVVKLQLSDLGETGQVVGRLSALGTAGAILGTFVTGFVLIAAFPTRPIVVALGVGLVVGGVGLWWWLIPRAQRERRTGTLALLGLFAVGLSWASVDPCETESLYYCARVEVDPERASGRILVLDTLTHSYVDVQDPTYLGFGYTQVFADVLSTIGDTDEPLRVLHIGGGGFTMPRWLSAARPGSDNVVFEIDPQLVELAERQLGLRPGPGLRVRTVDARMGIDTLEPGAFDVVIGDAFGGLAVPWHLTTIEFVEQVTTVLRPGGVYMINVIDSGPLGFARAKAATMRAAFEHVALLAPPTRLDGAQGGNFVIVGSDAPLDLRGIRSAIEDRAGPDEIAVGHAYDAFAGEATVLVDDYAPVDQLLTPFR